MTHRSRFAALLVFLSSGLACSQTLLTNPVECRRDDGSAIRCYLELRAPESRSTELLVVLQGSDCNSVRRIKAIARLEGVYPEADVLSVEKYGVTEDLPYSDSAQRPDCPSGYLERDNPEQRVSDVDRVVRALRAAKGYQKIVVIGGSEGSVVANLLSSRADYVDATVLFAGGGRYFLDDVLHSMKYTSSSENELKKNVAGFTQFAQYLLSHEAFHIDMSNHGYSWWRGMLSIDQEALLEAAKGPVLLVQGGDDQSASPEKAGEMAAELKAKGKTNIDYVLYPGYNHSLNLSLPDSSADLVIADIRAWLQGKLGAQGSGPRA